MNPLFASLFEWTRPQRGPAVAAMLSLQAMLSVLCTGCDPITAPLQAAVAAPAADPPVGLLYLAQAPDWDYRYLKNVLLRSQLHRTWTLMTSADTGFVQPCSDGEPPLTGYPSGAPLRDRYRLVIASDVAPASLRADPTTRPIAEQWIEFVHAGGTLILTPGSALSDPDLSSILPVRDIASLDDAPFGVAFTAAGQELDPRPPTTPDFEIQDSLPLLERRVGGTAVDDAVVLAHTDDPVAAPLIVQRRSGQGRVIAVLFRDSWRWRPATHELLWTKLVQ